MHGTSNAKHCMLQLEAKTHRHKAHHLKNRTSWPSPEARGWTSGATTSRACLTTSHTLYRQPHVWPGTSTCQPLFGVHLRRTPKAVAHLHCWLRPACSGLVLSGLCPVYRQWPGSVLKSCASILLASRSATSMTCFDLLLLLLEKSCYRRSLRHGVQDHPVDHHGHKPSPLQKATGKATAWTWPAMLTLLFSLTFLVCMLVAVPCLAVCL